MWGKKSFLVFLAILLIFVFISGCTSNTKTVAVRNSTFSIPSEFNNTYTYEKTYLKNITPDKIRIITVEQYDNKSDFENEMQRSADSTEFGGSKSFDTIYNITINGINVTVYKDSSSSPTQTGWSEKYYFEKNGKYYSISMVRAKDSSEQINYIVNLIVNSMG